ncbi:MAG: protein kinase [Deltaproteobacteria bacterium]|nr:protein kinase [Deltaproteobacteria bacterium]
MSHTPDDIGSDFTGEPERTDRNEAPVNPWQERTDLGAPEQPVEVDSAEGSHFGTIAVERLPLTPPPPPKPAGDPWVGRMVAGRYRIERPIAAGGMGKVYLATQLPLGRLVALKMVRTDVGGSREQFVRRFFLEASASAKLTHPNIVIVHDYGESEGGDVFMAMEYLDGRALDREIKDTAPMPPERALHIGIQIGRALREAHAKGIIHRDLKPQNVMLVHSGDESDFVKVLDFGLVKMFQAGEESGGGQDLTRAGVLLGSPNYMSPEQILGGALDPRTDIYSFGVVLYKMLTGKNPFTRDDAVDVIYKHVYHPVPTLAVTGVQLPSEVEAVVAKCLAKAKEDRFESCKELVLGLKEARKAALGGASQRRKKKKREEEEAEAAAAASNQILVPPAPLEMAPVAVLPAEAVKPVEDAASQASSASAGAGAAADAAAPLPVVETPSLGGRLRSTSRVRAGSVASAPHQAAVYLRGPDGQPIGPVRMRELEVLFCERILDEETPVSQDGTNFGAIGQSGRIFERLRAVQQRALSGQDPWREDSSAEDDTTKAPLRLMFECALQERTGVLCFPRSDGDLRLKYVQGRIIEVDTDIPALTLSRFLIDKKVFSEEALSSKLPSPPRRSAELGDALVASGLVPPHIFLERLIAWAKEVVATAATLEQGSAGWENAEVSAARVPLGFDRLGILADALRLPVDREAINEVIERKQTTLIIPSTPEGVTIDDFKLNPKELRLLRSVDGTKTMQELAEGAKDRAQRESTERTLFFAIGVGLLVYGEDQLAGKERQQAQELVETYNKLKDADPFTILGAAPTATDDDVRNRYKEMAKKYHTDNVRPDATPELVEAMRNLFTLVQAAFEAIEGKEKRDKYAMMKKLGYDATYSEEEVVRRILEAEVLFKKAKTFIKLSKYEEGLAAIKEAILRKPKDIELRVHARYFDFLAVRGGDKAAEAHRAIQDILALIKDLDDELASAYFFLGKLHKTVNRDDLAVKYFKKVLKFDPKNHDAESEIRLANMRDQKKAKGKGLLGSMGRLAGLATGGVVGGGGDEEDEAGDDDFEDEEGGRSSSPPKAKARGASSAGRGGPGGKSRPSGPPGRPTHPAGRGASSPGRSIPPKGK